jgi:hypothetical protein
VTWIIDPDQIGRALESAGFDVDYADADRQGAGGSLTARKERGRATMTLWADAGGRVRLEVTHEREEPWAGSFELKSTEFRAVRSIREVLMIKGTVTDAEVFHALAALSAEDLRAMVPRTGRRSEESDEQ